MIKFKLVLYRILSVAKENKRRSVSRRRFAKLVGGASTIGATGLTGVASASESDEQIPIRKDKKDASDQHAVTALRTNAAKTLLESCGIVGVDTTDTSRESSDHLLVEMGIDQPETQIVTTYIDESLFIEEIQIQSAVGLLKIAYDGSVEAEDSTVISGGIELNYEGLSQETREQIAGEVGWPNGTEGILVYNTDDNSVKFTRELTESEESRVSPAYGRENAGGTGSAESVRVISSGARRTLGETDGEFITASPNSVYSKDVTSGEISETRRQPSSSGGAIHATREECGDKFTFCVVDIVMASPHCTLAGIACGITGPATAGCVAAVLSLCLPNIALIYVSGNCTFVANNCME